ncbi:MAG: VOC family protein [Gammaproteobacteria bacterium]|nr:VOC family protein [Gammaproteobacteria bacterium]
MAENQIDYIEIPARDPAEARSFFEQLFGWRFEDYGPDYVSFGDGRMVGGFYRSDAVASVASGSVLVVFYRADLREAIDRITALGGNISKEIFAFPGGHRFHFTDPSGNEYAVWSDQEQKQ